MPRKARKHQLGENIIYHITNRGNRKLKIFHDGEDHNKFKKLLIKYKSKKGLIIYHYSIMPNHYHLEVEIENPETISSIMAGINRAYTAYYHKKYDTSGYLWQGRFKSIAIEKDAHLTRCGRYIERNPVDAHMVEFAENYEHSSAGYYVRGKKDEVVTHDKMYESFGNNDKERRENYRKYSMEEDIEGKKLYDGNTVVAGSNEFKKKMCKKKGRWVPKRRGNTKARILLQPSMD